MKKILSIIFVALFASNSIAQHTFSIVAVDTMTREVGSAGASCVGTAFSAKIISDVHPGVGGIHTQAYYLQSNQNYAQSLMDDGHSPQEIIDSVVAHDVQNNPSIRQYGVVDFVNGGRSAGWTGSGCMDYKNNLNGKTYSIQGNILLGRQILDSMEARFLRTPGRLEERLMAALQGAKVVGADTRCTNDGTSSTSAFLRVAKPENSVDSLYLDIEASFLSPGIEPIDSLQTLFTAWKKTMSIPENFSAVKNFSVRVVPTPCTSQATFIFSAPVHDARFTLRDVLARQCAEKGTLSGEHFTFERGTLPRGIYFYQFNGREGILANGKLIIE